MRRRIGIVPQELCLLEDRSAQLNVVLPLEIDGIPRSMSIARAADACSTARPRGRGAAAGRASCRRSTRQRVAVARALVREPELVIADHPTSMQDAAGAELVCGALAEAPSAAPRARVRPRSRRCARSPSATAGASSRWSTACSAAGASSAHIDELLARSSARPRSCRVDVPNVLPFPISARTAGVA